jgi:hypothetical protein
MFSPDPIKLLDSAEECRTLADQAQISGHPDVQSLLLERAHLYESMAALLAKSRMLGELKATGDA